MKILDTNTQDGNDKVCKCGHLLEDHEEYIGWICTVENCKCYKYEER